jgi:hypothetical protein
VAHLSVASWRGGEGKVGAHVVRLSRWPLVKPLVRRGNHRTACAVEAISSLEMVSVGRSDGMPG